ncbi:GNAT family N-acetyltransferase [Candidatus Viridilinea mediisalina]|uniref:GNAT family N-acetyltransferase n=1 Tax=Candidatus Viridilinea mediisalina TaxID=2024553 RepID=UPI000F599343|nr:GNAT family N-acetyltransferase [Candidatus Viridilinea mediisalina]
MHLTAQRFKRLNPLNKVLVYTQGSLSDIPTLPEGHKFTIQEMDMCSPSDINTWLTIYNDAFRRQWDAEQFKKDVLQHPHVLVTNTFFLLAHSKPIGITSIGVFRRNQDIGVGHYIGIKHSWQGKGIGRYLAILRFNLLKCRNIAIAESETTLRHQDSIRLHFSLGFKPKKKPDYWNTNDQSLRIFKFLAWHNLHKMYQDWVLTKN